MNAAKLRLSPEEMELVTNAKWILTKNGIMQKARWLLEDVEAVIFEFINNNRQILPPEIIQPFPKISRGENYKGLPYLVLDYPRYFQKKNIYAIRCIFWWGNFFSITLHLSGIYKEQMADALKNSYQLLKENDFSISASNDEWEHHFENTNYTPIRTMTIDQFHENISTLPFIKIAKQFPLANWDDASGSLQQNFKLLATLGAF